MYSYVYRERYVYKRGRCKSGPYVLRLDEHVVMSLTPTCAFATVHANVCI